MWDPETRDRLNREAEEKAAQKRQDTLKERAAFEQARDEYDAKEHRHRLARDLSSTMVGDILRQKYPQFYGSGHVAERLNARSGDLISRLTVEDYGFMKAMGVSL